MTTAQTQHYRGYKIVPLGQWASWLRKPTPRGLIYPYWCTPLCALGHRGKTSLWPKPGGASTAFLLASMGGTTNPQSEARALTRSGVARALEFSALSCSPRCEGFNSGAHGHRAEAVQGAVG
jgi:hypothetical protein